ncbi:hypothetical protein D5F01_LYC12724 [Larimichthys crocea]|uniref:Uncharacterized protein n=1 Tax=Larimichthys crocea TaxID=215358 RepID=A0A6G0IBX0_LARCR|nr:hypothetical protein D5F01_LYC12724 [Larimichthys crocea]
MATKPLSADTFALTFPVPWTRMCGTTISRGRMTVPDPLSPSSSEKTWTSLCKNTDFWIMAAIRAFFILLVCLLLARQAFAKNEAPCQLSKWNNGYNTFVKRHICSVTQNSLSISNWEHCIRNNGSCDRPTQSFLQPKDMDKVKGVCTSEGGVIYKENLCISRQSFTFVTLTAAAKIRIAG